MVINPKIVGIILIALAFLWLIGAYTAWFIYRRKHQDFTKEIVRLIWPSRSDKPE